MSLRRSALRRTAVKLSRVLFAACLWLSLVPAHLYPQSGSPSISSISPSRKEAGRSGFVLSVTGTGFVSASVVRWNGLVRTTTFVSTTQLSAVILEDDIAAEGDCVVTVSNPSPGSVSNAVTFTVAPSVSISGVSPGTITAGGPDFTLTVRGSGFAAGDRIRWNGQTGPNREPLFKQTFFISSTELRAQILAADIAQGAPDSGWSVHVHDSAGKFLAGAVSTSLNPVPVISSFNPPSALAGDSGFNLAIRGIGFVLPVATEGVAGTSVRWKGANRSATIVSSEELVVGIAASDISVQGSGDITVSNPTPGGGESTKTYSIKRFAELYFPRLVTRNRRAVTSDDSRFDGVAVVNLNSSNTADLLLTAFDGLGAPIAGPGITNPARLSLAPGSQQAVVDVQLFGAALADRSTVGWMLVESTVRRLVGFFLMFNSTLSVLDGADVGPSAMTSFVLPEIEDEGTTQFHIVNPGASAASVTLDLLTSAGLSRISPVVRTLDPHASLTISTLDLFPGAARSASDYVRASSTQGLVAFEAIGNADQFVAGLNGQSTMGGAKVLYSPQYVVGSTYRSTLSVINLESRPGTVVFEWLDDSGARIGTFQSRPIAAKGKIYVSDQSFFASAGNTSLQGYVRITSDGPKLTGSVAFGDPGRSVFLTALPLVAALRTEFVFSQLASDETYFTGMAILNPHEFGALATIEVRDENGSLIATKIEDIPAGQRKSQLITQYFPHLAGQNRTRGYIRVSTNRGVASFALYGTHNLSVLSALPPQPIP